MGLIVKCSICHEKLGDLTDQPVEFYRAMVVCSNGHSVQSVEAEEE